MGYTSSVVDPSKGFGLQSTVAERLKAAYAKGDFTFLNELDQFLVASPERRAMLAQGREFRETMTIPIDRSKPFRPETFRDHVIYSDWAVAEEDDSALALSEVTLENVQLMNVSEKDESSMGGGEKCLENMKKAGHTRLDAKFFQTLWENQLLIPYSWKKICDGDKEIRIYFDGTVIVDIGEDANNHKGTRYVICLYREDNKWCYGVEWLGNGRFDWRTQRPTEYTNKLSAVIPASASEEVELFRGLSAEIDLDAIPALPFKNGLVEEHKKGGRVTIQRRHDGLYIEGDKVVLRHTKHQLGGEGGKTIQGHELVREVDNVSVSSACVLDFLMANQEFVPDEMKKVAEDDTLYTFFWDTIYRASTGCLCVRYCFWDTDGMKQDCVWVMAGSNPGNRSFAGPQGCFVE